MLESQECPYLPLHGAEVAWLLVEVFVKKLLVAAVARPSVPCEWLVRSWDSAALLLLRCQAQLGMVQSARQELITSWNTKYLNRWSFPDSITSTITVKQNI